MSRPVTWSKTVTFFEDDWHEGNVPIMGVAHPCGLALHLGVRWRARFRGRRSRPRSALRARQRIRQGHEPQAARSDGDLDGARARGPQALRSRRRALYPADVLAGGRAPQARCGPTPKPTRWCLTLYVAPLPKPTGTAITLSPFRRPTRETAPVDAKAGCLYPNNARALIEARSRGFDNCLMCDMLGNVAELGTANIFMAKDGVVFTPAANGTFLAGITRARVIGLLREAGITVVETTLRYSDFQSADEIFSTGNYTKVSPITRIDDRDLQPGPFYRRARELYWDFAHATAAITV